MNAHNHKEIKRLLMAVSAAIVFAASAPAIARVMPATLTSWANTTIGLSPAPALAESTTAMADTPTQIRLRVLDGCGPTYGAVYTLKVNGQTLGTASATGACSCGATPYTAITVTNPALLALVTSDNTCTAVSVSHSNNLHVTWVKVEIDRPSGNTSMCLFGNCSFTTLCQGNVFGSNRTFSNNLPDQDNDGIPNCSDNDNDNDLIPDATDNCPATPNPTQVDADSNGTGDACDVARVVAVPWLGTEALPHQVTPGGQMVLQAVATLKGTVDSPVEIKSATWDPGDGSGPVSVPVGNSLALELKHTYNGAVGQPFTAVVEVTDIGNNKFTDTFKVVIGPDDRETKVNMAIDKALWNLHKNMLRTTSDGQPSGYWTGHSVYHMSSSASTVQAFEINNHRESGDPTKDPYVNDVRRGMRYILSMQHGYLKKLAVSLQNGTDNPEQGQAAPNGWGLQVSPSEIVNPDHAVYLSGQLIDAIVSSGTPDKTAETGNNIVLNRKYKDIVQDILDAYSFGMNDQYGGWHYSMNDQPLGRSNDTSASHWWAIGVLAAEVWGLDAPQWVKTRNWTIGIPLMQVAPPGDPNYPGQGCYFGYTGSATNWWGDNQTNVTAGGLILMNADDVPQTDPRFQCAMKWLDTKYTASNSWGNFYTMYQTAKAMRTAQNSSGSVQEIELLNGTRNWYNDYADYLIANQNNYTTGEFRAVTGQIGPSYIQGNLATSWGVIILSPSLFQLPPAAACVATPNELGTVGGTVNFSAAGSTHPDSAATIVSYEWDFGDGGTQAASASATTSHNYANPGTFPTVRQAKVTVKDSNGLSDSAFCPVTITDTNVKPSPNAGGPYTMCMGTSLTLDGSASFDPDGTITAYKWSFGPPINFGAPNATTAVVDGTAFFTAKGPGTWSAGLEVTDNLGKTNTVFTPVNVLAASNPACNQPPDAVDDATSTFAGTPVTISVLANDTDPDVPPQTLIVTETTQALNGVVTTNGTTATYTPALGFYGTNTFTYTLSDGKGGTDTATVTVVVSRRLATVTAGSGNKVYGQADPSMTPSAVGFLAADGITLSQTRDSGNDIGSYATNATATGATIANYDVTYIPGALVITPAAVTATAGSGSSVYDGQMHAASACVVTGDYTGDLTCSNSTGAGPGIGTTTISPVVSGTGLGNYTITPVDGSYSITPAAVTVTAGSGSNVYDGQTHAASACVVTGDYTGDLTCSNSTGAGPGIGTTTISPVVSGTGLGNYTITPVDGSYSITPAAVTVTAGSGSNVYDGQTHAASACVVTGDYTGDLTCSNSTGAGPGIGTTTISPVVSGTGLGNYTITPVDGSYSITPAAVTVTAGSGSNVYDGQTHAASACVVTGDYTGDLTCANGPAVVGPNVGTTAISPIVNGSGLDNYTITPVDGSYSITPAAVTVTAGSGSNVYDGASHAPSACAVTGAYTGDLACTNSPASVGPNVSTIATTPVLTGSGLDNYDITTVGGSYEITLAPSTTVVTCPASVIYTGAAITPCTANVTGAGGLDEAVSPVSYSDNTNVGTAGASATYGGDSNHSSSTGATSFEITAAATSTAVNAPSITHAANGVVTVTVSSASGTPTGSVSLMVDGGPSMTQPLNGAGSATFTVSSPNAGDHPLVASYAAQGNFSASSATGNLHVDKAPTQTTLTSTPSPQAAGQTVTLTATVVSVLPGSGTPVGNVTFYDGATAIGTVAVNGAGVAVLTTTTLSNGPHTISSTFNESQNFLASSSNTASQLIYGYPVGGGTFVVGDQNATLNNSVTFWGAQWEKLNTMSGGATRNHAFKGFAISPAPPTVGATFTSAPGNSAPPPAAVPEYLGIIVTSKVTKSGSNITGTIVKLVVVKVNPGYAGNPGNAGTGTVVAILP